MQKVHPVRSFSMHASSYKDGWTSTQMIGAESSLSTFHTLSNTRSPGDTSLVWATIQNWHNFIADSFLIRMISIMKISVQFQGFFFYILVHFITLSFYNERMKVIKDYTLYIPMLKSPLPLWPNPNQRDHVLNKLELTQFGDAFSHRFQIFWQNGFWEDYKYFILYVPK